ncbi:MAG: helix-turn-helix domain-containing protein [Acidobacteria bacterium]|nr:helix-turn-helix domain-containing protein [Acidobacteriota bacterium]
MAHETGMLNLAAIRGNRRITLDQISQATKISRRSLEAIESGDFKKLPGGVYNTNYIRQYAKAIDYDEDELLAFYYAKTKTGPGAGPSDPTLPADLFDRFRPASHWVR